MWHETFFNKSLSQTNRITYNNLNESSVKLHLIQQIPLSSADPSRPWRKCTNLWKSMIYILYILVIYGDPNILVRNHRDNVLPDSCANDTQQGDGDHIMRGDFAHLQMWLQRNLCERWSSGCSNQLNQKSEWFSSNCNWECLVTSCV